MSPNLATDVTPSSLLTLSVDLIRGLTRKDRFEYLLDRLRKAIECDAVALLVFRKFKDEKQLIPLAIEGLAKETLGRRFNIADHPRFEIICKSEHPVRFQADCPLPDPYDGLIQLHSGALPIHSCMGLPLHFQNTLIGVLTLDSLTPRVFDELPENTLELIGHIAAVCLHTAMAIEAMESNIHRSQQLVEELSHPLQSPLDSDLIGKSPSMEKLRKEVKLVAPSDYTVLIQGESGTGKEVVAHALHFYSKRNHSPMIYVNCAALPENLIESELFGHVKGAFTGADKDRPGKFSLANQGTLFLDEIGELPLNAQSKLLRAIQNKEIQAVGQDQCIDIDVRIIAATNRNLEHEVETGKFRKDLFHRLNVYPVNIPPLRERHGDIALLAGFFIEKVRRKLGYQQLRLAEGVIEYLSEYQWPGNVRELEHMISRAALKAGQNHASNELVIIKVSDCDTLTPILPDKPRAPLTSQVPTQTTFHLKSEVENFQRNLIASILHEEQGNWTTAAKRMQTDRANLNRLAKRLGISIKKQVNYSQPIINCSRSGWSS